MMDICKPRTREPEIGGKREREDEKTERHTQSKRVVTQNMYVLKECGPPKHTSSPT